MNFPNQKSGVRRIILLAIAFLVVLTTMGITYWQITNNGTSSNRSGSLSGILRLPTPAPTPFPFEELTLPYLRARNYYSSLGPQVIIGRTTTYSSYLTSYLSDGFTINGLLTIPEGNIPAGGWPAIVFVHGYIPPSLYQTTQKYEDYINYLASRGYVVFKIDLRGHGNSEGEANGAYYSSDYVIDTLNAYSALQNADFVNSSRVGIWGHSMAGNVTFRAFVAKQDIPALVIWAGAVYTYEDFAKYRISDNSYRPPSDNTARLRYRELLSNTYGDFDPASEFWKQVPATNYLGGVVGAIQINHAVNDTVVNIGYSRDLVDLLEKTPITHELHEYPSGGHNIDGSYFTNAMQNTVKFFDNHLK